MARPPRPDKRPRFGLPDTREVQRRVNDTLDDGYRAKVRQGGNPAGDTFVCVLDEKERWLSIIRNKRFPVRKNKFICLDEGLFSFLLSSVKHARATPVYTSDGTYLIEGRNIIHEMSVVGCRVEMTQKQVADAYGCSRSYVADQLWLFRHLLLIVNWGDGWWEFDASLVWRGDLEFLRAYREVQPMQPLEIVSSVTKEHLSESELSKIESDIKG